MRFYKVLENIFIYKIDFNMKFARCAIADVMK